MQSVFDISFLFPKNLETTASTIGTKNPAEKNTLKESYSVSNIPSEIFLKLF